MSSIEVYSFEDADGAPESYTTQDIDEARQRARRRGLKLIANVYEWADSELIEDNHERSLG